MSTNLETALDFAGQMTDRSKSILLVTDGLATDGDTLAAAARLAAAGVRVDVWQLPAVAVGQDVAVEGILLPSTLWVGEPFSVTVQLLARADTPAHLDVVRDGQTIASLDLSLTAGENQITLATTADVEGLSAFEARVTSVNDGRPENNFAGAVVNVQPAPSVLIAASQAETGQRLQAALASQGIAAQLTSPAEMPRDTTALQAYQVLVLMDVPAATLSLEQQSALEAFVYAQGHGLIFTGGPSAYSLGGYDNTAFEQMLPVSLQPPPRGERAPASLLLIIDRSGSMNGTKLELTKEAAMRAVEVLQPTDRVGVLVFDDLWEWRVPLTELGQGAQLRGVLDSIGTIVSRGGTDLLTPLEVGVGALSALPDLNKHVVVLSDGISSSGTPDEFRLITEAGLAADVTISTIAIGGNADTQLMESIAEWGQGRFHVATTPESIPQLVLAESRAVLSESIQQGLYPGGRFRRPIRWSVGFAPPICRPLKATWPCRRGPLPRPTWCCARRCKTRCWRPGNMAWGAWWPGRATWAGFGHRPGAIGPS